MLAERSLLTLGAAPPLCMEILAAWRELREIDLIEHFLVGGDMPAVADLRLRRLRFWSAVREVAQPMPFPAAMTQRSTCPGASRRRRP